MVINTFGIFPHIVSEKPQDTIRGLRFSLLSFGVGGGKIGAFFFFLFPMCSHHVPIKFPNGSSSFSNKKSQ